MLKFIDKPSVHIPETNNRYTISIQGAIIDHAQNNLVLPEDSKVKLVIFEKEVTVSLAWIIAFSFKPLYRSETFCFNWTILFADNNIFNIHPGNLIWKPPKDGQHDPENIGYYIVPGHTKQSVTKEGLVYNREYNKQVSVKQEKIAYKRGYVKTIAYRDNNVSNGIGLHRLLALAFIEYDNTVPFLTVNHINGIKNDNKLSNLEWATFSRNNTHAMDLELRKSRRPVSVKDYFTGEVHSFIALGFAAEFLDLNSGYLRQYLKDNRSLLLSNKYVARYTDQEYTWPIYTKEEIELNRSINIANRISLHCCAYNILTGDLFIAETPGKLGGLIDFTVDQAATAVESPYIWPSNNYICFPLCKPKQILIFSPEELECFKNRSGIKNPVLLTTSDGNKKVYASPSEASVALGFSKRELTDKIYQNDGIYTTDTFTISYITHKPIYEYP